MQRRKKKKNKPQNQHLQSATDRDTLKVANDDFNREQFSPFPPYSCWSLERKEPWFDAALTLRRWNGMYVARICQDGGEKKKQVHLELSCSLNRSPKSESLMLLLLRLLRLAAGLLHNEHFLIAMCFSLAGSCMCAAAD